MVDGDEVSIAIGVSYLLENTVKNQFLEDIVLNDGNGSLTRTTTYRLGEIKITPQNNDEADNLREVQKEGNGYLSSGDFEDVEMQYCNDEVEWDSDDFDVDTHLADYEAAEYDGDFLEFLENEKEFQIDKVEYHITEGIRVSQD